MDKSFSAEGREAEISRAQTDLLAHAGGMILEGVSMARILPEAISIIERIAAYDQRAAQYRLREAEVTGKSQRNPFSDSALKRLIAAVGESLEELLKIAPGALGDAAALAAVRVSLAAASLATPIYRDREAHFALELLAAHQKRRRANRPQEPRRQRKRPAARESDTYLKALAALTAHHVSYDGLTNTRPISHSELASQAQISQASVTRFFQRAFSDFESYVRLCEKQPESIPARLRVLTENRLRGVALTREPVADPDFMFKEPDEMERDYSAPRKPLRHNALVRTGDTRRA